MGEREPIKRPPPTHRINLYRATAMNELIEKLEKATGPDRMLDAHIALAAGLYDHMRFEPTDVLIIGKLTINDGHELDVVGQNGGCVGYTEHPKHYTASLDAALTLLPPGFWWRGGTCCVSSEATVCPDHNDPTHRERLLAECPPTIEHWNSGIEVELRPGSEHALVRALVAACLRARQALTADLSQGK